MNEAKLDVVILAAGLGRRMKSYGPKALINIGSETVIGRQLRLLKSVYPDARVFTVLGHEANRIRKVLPPEVKVVMNKEFETTNVAKSIQLGLAATSVNRHTLLIYGDLIFTKNALRAPINGTSSVLIDYGKRREDEVGVNIANGSVVHFSYGLEAKWGQIAMLAPNEKKLFQSIFKKYEHSCRLFGYEMFNRMIDAGCEFRAISHDDNRFLEIDTAGDIERVTGQLTSFDIKSY